ncbi:hypothetical protein AAGG52_13125 [Bacillus licheniformis]
MLFFAKEWLPVSPSSLFVSILQAVLLPIIAGLIVQFFFKKQVKKLFRRFRSSPFSASSPSSPQSSEAIGKTLFNRGC